MLLEWRWVNVIVYILMEVFNSDEDRKSSLNLQIMLDATSAHTLIMPKSSQCFTYFASSRCKSGQYFKCRPY